MENKFSWFFAFLFLLLAFSPSRITAQSFIKLKTENGISIERLHRYDAFLNKEVAKGHIAGAVSLVSRNGEIVHKASYGLNSLGNEKPMQQDGIFHIMSMTKPIITVGFMMLYEEGYFFLNDPVSKYLPQFKDLRVAIETSAGKDGPSQPANKEITIATRRTRSKIKVDATAT